jgi:enediyne biosynthesis protein E4
VRALLLAAGLAACAPPRTPIVFTEVTGARVPSLAQTMFVPNNGFNNGLGAAVGDVDGDGRLDLYLASGGVFLNKPDAAGFRLEASAAPGPPADATWLGAAFGDFDRDGALDLAVCGQGGVRLWKNDGAGGFVDVTAAAGVGGAADDVSLAVAWGDLDGDGWLDLAVADYGFSLHANDAQPSHLYLNHRDGTFAELAAPVRSFDVRAWVVTLADFDGDGRLDLHLGDDTVIPFLGQKTGRHDLVFTNRGLDAGGQLALVESSAALGLAEERATMGCALGNADRGDGWDALFTDIQATWLFRGAGGAFRDVTRASAIDLAGPNGEAWWQWGSVFADLDGDGFEDALVAQSEVFVNQDGAEAVGPVLLRNVGGRFELQRYAFGGPMNARAVVLADLDGDGDQDVVVAPFFDRFRFFVNATRPRRFLRVQLAPTVSAPGAAGAVVVARAGDVVQKRMRVAGGQPHSSGEEVLDFGLDSAAAAEVTVTWPSGAIERVAAASGLTVITEPRWLALSNPRPPADGATHVTLTVDAAQAGLGGAGSRVHVAGGALALDAACDASGVASFDLPPRAQAGAVQLTLTVDGRELPAHPAIDYR